MDSGISQTLKDLQSPNNETRQKAEQHLASLRASSATQLLEAFVQFIIASSNGDADHAEKALACVLFKKYFLDGRKEEANLQQITPEQATVAKNVIKQSLNFAQDSLHLLRRKAEIICKLHKLDSSYGEIVQQIQQLASQPSSPAEEVIKAKQFAMYAMELLSEFHLPQDQMVQNSQNFMQLFQHSLSDGEIKVKVATLKALAAFLTMFEDEDDVMKYKNMMGPLIDLVISVLQNSEEEGKTALQSLIELTQSYPAVWEETCGKLIYVCSDVMKTAAFDASTRQTALELVSTLADQSAKMLRAQTDALKQHFFPAIFIMLTEVEDNVADWAERMEEELHGDKDSVDSIAADALERLSEQLGEKTITQCCMHMIIEGANNQQWQFRQAAFVFLGMIAESCDKFFQKNFTDAVQLVSKGIVDGECRVRYQALMALGLILNVASPMIQTKYHQDFMPMFLKMISDEEMVKLKAQTVSCTINFVKGLIEEGEDDDDKKKKHAQILDPYIQPLVKAIQAMLDLGIKANYAPLQGETLGLLSVMAELLADKFAALYSSFMPALKTILQNTPMEKTEQKELRGNCISAIANILDSVKDQPEVCRVDALEITTQLVGSLKHLEDTDPQLQSIQNAISMLASSLKHEFKPFLPELMESLFKDLKRDLDFKLVDATEEELENNEEGSKVQQIKLSIKGVEGAKMISMNTTALENKITALQILGQVAQALGTNYSEYVGATCEQLGTLMHDKLSSSVRKNSTKLCFVMVDACPTDESKIQVLKLLTPHIVQEINYRLKQVELPAIKWLTKELQRSFNAVNMVRNVNFLSEGESSQLLDLCVNILEATMQDKATRLQQFEKERKKMDEEDEEIFYEQLEKADKVWTYIMDLSATLVKCMPDQCSPQVQSKLLPLYGRALLDLHSKKTEGQIIDALCFLCDCLEFGNQALFDAVYPHAGPKMLEVIEVHGKKKFDYVQTSIFALGCMAYRRPTGSFDPLEKTVAVVQQMFQNAQFFTDEKGRMHTCLDNAVSCLGKICYRHQVPAQTTQLFLSKLPCILDDEEAPAVHKMFLQQVLSGNQNLAPFENEVKQTIQRIATAYEQKKDVIELLDEEGQRLCQQLLPNV